MTNAVEEFRATRLHPFARLIAKWPLLMTVVSYGVFVLLAVIGGSSINVRFGAPAGRTPYSPTDAVETFRLDMYINAQRVVDIKSVETERQTVPFRGYTLFFEEVDEKGEANLDADIFTEENLERIFRAQRVIENSRDYDAFCWRCPTEEGIECAKAKATLNAAGELIAALNSVSDTAADAAADMVAAATGLCNALSETCDIKKAAEAAEEIVGALPDGYNENQTSAALQAALPVRAGANATAQGVCARLAGCEDATANKHKCQRAYSPLTYFCKDPDDCKPEDGWNSLDKAFRKLDSEVSTPDADEIPDRTSVFPASFFLPHYYEKGDRKAHATRLTVQTGMPLGGYEDEHDRTEEQEKKIEAYLIELIPKLEALREEYEAEGKLAFRWLADNPVINVYFQQVLGRDVAFALGAVVFVLLYITFHTRSLFLAVTCLFGVVLCFPVGAFWAIVVIGVTFFDPLNMFLLFILLGLGADGVFIVFDQWEQSREGMQYWVELHGEADAPLYRMSYVWRRASKSMFACNITTALAFCAAIPSPVMPMAAFGILSAITIIHNWLLDVTVVPALILLWDTHLRHRYVCCIPPALWQASCFARLLPCCTAKASGGADAKGAGAGAAPSGSESRVVDSSARAHAPSGAESATIVIDGDDEQSGEHNSLNKTELFFRDRFAPFIIKFRFVILALMVALIGTMVYFTSQLEPSRESPAVLPDDEPLWRALLSQRDGWMEGDSELRAEMWMVWGIKDNDYGQFSKFDYESEACNEGPCGEAVFDESFDPSSTSMQEYLLDVCEAARDIEATLGRPGTEFVYKRRLTHCFMKDFKAFLESNRKEFPVEDEDEFWEQASNYLKEPQENEPGGEGYDYIQRKFLKVGRDGDGDVTRIYFMISGVQIDFNPRLFYGIPEIEPGLEASYAFEAEQNEKKPKGQPDFFVTTSSGVFMSMRMQQAYISSAVSGVLIAMAFAAFSLILFVGNVVVAAIALVCIGGVVCCTLGLMVVQGWTLGLIEAICATIVVGFSVDYVVHYALAYVHAPQPDRNGRLTHALVEVGISVQAGAITTIGASAFLLLTTLQFFFKFGVFMLMTVSFSLLTANFAFTALLAIVGPSGEFGDIHALFGRICARRQGDAKGAPADVQVA